MSWKRRKTRKGRNTYYSLSKKLRQEKRSNDEFETMLGSLSLEEIIGLKLELAAKAVGGMLFGIPIWYTMQDITKDAVLKYACSATRTKMEAARFLGLDKKRFNELVKKYQIESYFEDKD